MTEEEVKPAGAEIVGEVVVERLEALRFKVSFNYAEAEPGVDQDQRTIVRALFRKDGKLDFVILAPRDMSDSHFKKLSKLADKVGTAGCRYLLIAYRSPNRFVELSFSDDPLPRGGTDDLPDVLIDAKERAVLT